jgi:predicted nucleic acid-binding protein
MSDTRRPCYFLDTSALLKLVWEEPGSDRVRGLCDEMSSDGAYTSELALAEAVNVVKKRWLKEAKSSDPAIRSSALEFYRRALKVLFFPLLYPFRVLPLGFSDKGARYSVLFEDDATQLDAVDLMQVYFLVDGDVANLIGSSSVVFVSADSELVAVAREMGLAVLHPCE